MKDLVNGLLIAGRVKDAIQTPIHIIPFQNRIIGLGVSEPSGGLAFDEREGCSLAD